MKHYLTSDDVKEIKNEIEFRKVVERKRLNEDVKEARAHGDLSENFEYKAAKRERGKNESRIRYLERMLKTADIIETIATIGEVGLGKEITLLFLDDNCEMTYKIVTTLHTDALNNKISIESPLGRALVGKRVNDIILISSPDGEYEVKILNIKEEGMS